MGFEADRFVSEVDDEFLCSICLSVFDEPVNGPCGHAFCSKCINNWIPLNVNSCPLDKKPLFRKDLMPACLPFRNLLGRLEIKCEFESAGCGQVAPLSQMDEHVRVCQYNPDGEMTCDLGCGLKFLRKAEGEHNCIEALKEQLTKKDQEIADLKRKGVKRPMDSSSRIDAMNRYLETQNAIRRRMHLQNIGSSSSGDRSMPFLDRIADLDVSQPGTSGARSDSPPHLQPQNVPLTEDMRTVRVMLRRLTDDQTRGRNIEEMRNLRYRSIHPTTSDRSDIPTLNFNNPLV